MNIEKELYPESDNLEIVEDGGGEITIVDGELDPIACEISEDAVQMDTSKYGYITLTRYNLNKLLEALDTIESDL